MKRILTVLFMTGLIVALFAGGMAATYAVGGLAEQYLFTGASRLTNILFLLLVFVMIIATMLTLAERKPGTPRVERERDRKELLTRLLSGEAG